MPQGFQAWDAQGRLVVDLTDYSTRFYSMFSIGIPGGDNAASVSVPGITPTTHMAAVTSNLTYGATAIVTPGVVTVRSLTGQSFGVIGQVIPFTVEVYAIG